MWLLAESARAAGRFHGRLMGNVGVSSQQPIIPREAADETEHRAHPHHMRDSAGIPPEFDGVTTRRSEYRLTSAVGRHNMPPDNVVVR
jgi:hypothetical protein